MRLSKPWAVGLGVIAMGVAVGAAVVLPLDASVQKEDDTFQVKNKQAQGYGKDDINEMCLSDNVTTPETGMHFDGSEASAAVLALAPGRYDYPDQGAMLFYPDGQFLLKLPEDGRSNTYGTDGSDLLAQGGIIGGCFAEQLSEAIANNSLEVDAFVLVNAYE